MSTKEKFLSEVKEVFDRFHIAFPNIKSNGIPDGTINNIENLLIQGFIITIPEEDIKVTVSGKEFIEYMCASNKD